MDQDNKKERKKKKLTKNSQKKQVKLNKAKKSNTSDELLQKAHGQKSFENIIRPERKLEGAIISPRATLKRERSTSNPEFIRTNVELALHIPNSQKLTANAFMGVSRKTLSNLLERNQIKKSSVTLSVSSGEFPSPRSPEKEQKLKSSSNSIEIKQKPIKIRSNNQIFSPVILHAFWCVKQQNLAPAGSLIKEILPLENFHLPRKWIVFIIVKEAHCSQHNSPIAPWLHAAVSINNGITHTTPPVLSLDPVWNQTFYFRVKDLKKDTLNVAVYFTRIRGKDTKEGGCVGKADIDIKSLQVSHGYKAPWDRWEPLHDPSNKSEAKPESFVRIIVQLVPDDVEAFGNIDAQTIRILPETANYKEQFGALISKNKLRKKQT